MAAIYRAPVQKVYRDVRDSSLPLRTRSTGRVLLDTIMLPRPVRQATIHRAEVWRKAFHNYEHHLAATREGTAIVLESWMTPSLTPLKTVGLHGNRKYELAKEAGIARHYDFPGYLLSFNRSFASDIQGLSSREQENTLPVATYSPQGLWDFVPPVSGDDWSTHARRIVQTDRSLPDLVAILMNRGLHNREDLTLAVTYDP